MANLAAHDAASPVSLSPGDVLDGKYRIERMLAEGGVGVVFLAHHLQLDRPVAIKLLRTEVLGDRDLVEQFEREARLCAKMKSEHVVRVHDVGVSPGIGPYMVMEYLEGGDLETALAEGPLPFETAVDYVLQACDALGEVHDYAIVHRDLKPANLFLASRPRNVPIVKVIDFGVSKVVPRRGATGWTADERLMAGTPGYMAPEQLRGTAVDARADVWALGVVLFELLTGEMPFVGKEIHVVCEAILKSDPTRLADLRPDLPPELDAIVHKCLQKDPSDRYPNVADLARALTPFGPATALDITPVAVRIPQTTDPRTTKATVVLERRRKSGLAVPIALAVGLAVVIAGAVLLVTRRAPTEPPAIASVAPPPSAVPTEVASPPAPVDNPPVVASSSPPVVASSAPKPIVKPVPKPRSTGRGDQFGTGRQ